MIPAYLCVAFAHGLGGQTPVKPTGGTDKRAAFVPMRERERLQQYAEALVSPVSVLTSAAGAGIGQWRDKPPEWNQGGQGYERRFASSYAEHVVQETLLFGVSSVTHEDNRYFRRGEGIFKTRLRYAIESTFLARHDDGSSHISISKMGAFAGGALISRAWQPESSGDLKNAGVNFWVSVAVAAGFSVAREFLPDLLHRR